MNRPFTLCLTILLLLCGCRTEEPVPQKTAQQQAPPPASLPLVQAGCTGCHGDVQLDPAHQFACTACHGGNDKEQQTDKAHNGLIAQPSHPDRMTVTCGGCHPNQVKAASNSSHFTLANKVNSIRRHFGAETSLTAAPEVPLAASIASPLTLADDMLRRRCLRCHVYGKGDEYDAVTHATGCGACHLAFKGGKLHRHAFAKPTDTQCLSCHYGNYVGSDYHGRYEHDYNWEYRTPYSTQTAHNTAPRPYGVEYHDLAPDLHQQRGLICIDCHRQSGHPQKKSTITCLTCHGWQSPQPPPTLGNLQVRNQGLILIGAADNKEHPVPMLRDHAHQRYGRKVACQVCHGQWSFNDAPTHLLLTKSPEIEPWERLTVQSSSEVESLLEHNLHYSQEKPMTMRDGLTGESRPGIWLQGYGQRRWEQMIVGKDTDGIIKVFRPLLDLRLSMVEADGQVPFDNVIGQGTGMLPYTPHTTGPAGMFFLDRFKHLLPPDPQ